MTTISGTSRANPSAWAETSGTRSNARAAKMFAKVDADGSGSVDKTELQGMLDHIAEKSGQSLGGADELMTKMDADGNGSLSQTELDAGMKSLMPAPSSTVDFAQQSQGMPPPPPPADGASSASGATDPLDTNGDGTVSAEERAAGALNEAIANLFAAADTDGDKTISQSEADTLQAKMDTVVQGLQDSSSASSSSTSDASGFSLSAFVDLVLKQYAQGAAASTSNDAASSLSVSA
jgi:Ca2+-binding EF-hand superfamily protein